MSDTTSLHNTPAFGGVDSERRTWLLIGEDDSEAALGQNRG